jgi:energy-converting hydrogenase Eha subunit H
LATWAEVKTFHKQQNSHIQSNIQTNLDLWNTTVGRFQYKVLCMIVDAPLFVPNALIRRDIQTTTIKEEIRHYSPQ